MILKVLFYMWAIFALLFELQLITNPKKWIDFKKSFKGVTYENMTSNQKYYSFMGLFYLLWAFVGLFSSQWVLFVLLTLIGIPFSVFKESKIAKQIDGALSSLFILFIVVNAFHLHINVYEFIINLF